MTVRALIFAGGTGLRMNTRATPKQFLELHGKPVILYTIEHFENHPEVDEIVVVCLENWIEELHQHLTKHGIEKVSTVVPGGDTGHDSIYLGLAAMSADAHDDDIVLIHDGVRPLISAALITENIATARAFGTAITAEAVLETTVRLHDNGSVREVIPREQMRIAKAPQTFRFALIWDLYQRARADGHSTVDSADLCSLYGADTRAVESTPYNMKITRPLDYYIFRALYEAMENEQILGLVEADRP